METVFAKIGFWMKASVAAVVAALAISCGDQMEVRTFELERLDAMAAMDLVAPYVFEERESNPGRMSQAEGLLTVRELPENLDRIEAVLRRYDREAASLQLRFQVIEADGFTETDEAIAEVEEELGNLLRYEGYRLVGEAVVQTREGQRGMQKIASRYGDTPPFQVFAEPGQVQRSENGDSVVLDVMLDHPWGGTLLETSVTVRDGQVMVLGTTAGNLDPDGPARAIILTVTPIID